jgi:hypothetical protein
MIGQTVGERGKTRRINNENDAFGESESTG